MKDIDIKQLKKYGYKLTFQREAVWNVLSSVKGHITPQTLHSLITKQYPEIGLVTVYRTLSIFSEAGLVCEVDCGDGLHHYSLHECNSDNCDEHEHHHHHHLVCTQCSEVIEFEVCDFSDITEKLAADTGYQIDFHKLDVFGLCPNCLKKGNK